MFKLIKKIFFLTLICITIYVSYFAYKGYTMYEKALSEKSIEQMKNEIEQVDDFTKLEQMPQIYLDAVVSVEDHRFYTNEFGFDIFSIGRAVINNIKSKELKEGGSTITQQLAKNTYFTQERKLERKFAEIFMANRYEKELEKDEILELYLNTCFFGNNCYTPNQASKYYFGKDISELTPGQSTLLAGIPNAPSVYNPKVNADLSKQRQKQVLSKMVNYGVITQEEMDYIYQMEI